MTIHLDIVTPERLAYTKDVDFVSVPTPQGTLGVLPRHVGLLSLLDEGEIMVKESGKTNYFAIGGGFMEVTKKRVLILVSRAYHADELNEAEIRRAEQAAREQLKRKGTAEEYSAAQAILRRSMIELHVLSRRKHKVSPSVS